MNTITKSCNFSGSVSDCLEKISQALKDHDRHEEVYNEVMSLPFIKKLIDERKVNELSNSDEVQLKLSNLQSRYDKLYERNLELEMVITDAGPVNEQATTFIKQLNIKIKEEKKSHIDRNKSDDVVDIDDDVTIIPAYIYSIDKTFVYKNDSDGREQMIKDQMVFDERDRKRFEKKSNQIEINDITEKLEKYVVVASNEFVEEEEEEEEDDVVETTEEEEEEEDGVVETTEEEEEEEDGVVETTEEEEEVDDVVETTEEEEEVDDVVETTEEEEEVDDVVETTEEEEEEEEDVVETTEEEEVEEEDVVETTEEEEVEEEDVVETEEEDVVETTEEEEVEEEEEEVETAEEDKGEGVTAEVKEGVEITEEDEGEEFEAYIVIIEGKKYYTNDDRDGNIYECLEDEDIGDLVGKFKDGGVHNLYCNNAPFK
jgi:hypothetical protein